MKKKDAILAAATRLFSEKGFRETRMSEISLLTGAAEGTIFYHFSSKEELFLTILEDFKENILMESKAFMANKPVESGLDMAENVISFYLNLAGSMDERFLLLHRHDAYELAQIKPECRECLEEIYNRFIDLFEQAIQSGQADGSIRDIPARKSAMILFAMVDGLVRFDTYRLYNAGALYGELIDACRRVLEEERHVH